MQNQLNHQQLKRWLEEDEVTRTIITALNLEKKDLIDRLLSRYSMEDPYFERNTSYYLGHLKQLDQVLEKENLIELLEKHGFIGGKVK